MKVGFIGAGKVTATFGRHLINAGHTSSYPIPERRRHWLILSLISVQAPSPARSSRQTSATSSFLPHIGSE